MQKLAKTALWVVLFGAVSSFAETDGWKNDGRARYVIPPAAKALWTAPLEKGIEAFTVTWSGGGAGTVAIVDLDGDKALEIVKTNDVGAVRIRPKEPFALPPAVKTKAFAAVSSSADDFEFARGELRMGPVGHEAGLPKGCTGLTVGGFKQMTWMPNTAPGAYAVKCAYADPLSKGEQAMSSITVSGTASRSLWRAWRIELVAAAVEAVRKDPARQPNVYSIISDQLHRLAASGVPFDCWLASDFDADPALAASYRYVVRRLTPSDKYLTPKEFNAQARAAGAYVPVPPNVLEVDMSGDFLSVHALRNGTFEFALPFPCAVRNVKSGKLEKVENGKFQISVEAGQTCWFTFF